MNTGTWRTDEQTKLLYQYRPSAYWRVIKNTSCGRRICVTYWNPVKNGFPTQNFTEIRAISCWVMAKNDFQYLSAVRHFAFKKIIFGHVTVIEFQCAIVCQISSKSDGFSLRYSDLTICNMAAVRHLEFSKFRLFCHAILLPCAKCRWNRTISCWIIVKKVFFTVAPVRHLEFKKSFIFGHVTMKNA